MKLFNDFYRGKVAVITGAGSGIGRALALDLAKAGALLALSDINQTAVDETMALCRNAGARCRADQLDVADWTAVHDYSAAVNKEFGQTDFVFNNAGVAMFASFVHATKEEIDWQLRINLHGVINGCKAFLPQMLAQGSGVLVNFSSVLGWVSAPGQSIYNVSKFGVRGLTECLWMELLGTGVRAVAVHPGGIRTNIDRGARRSVNADQFEAKLEKEAGALLRTSPERCARDILLGVRKGKNRIRTGYLSSVMSWLPRLLPDHYTGLLLRKLGLQAN